MNEDTIEELIATLQGEETVKVQSILSHLATSDDLVHREFTFLQIALFEKLSARIMTDLDINPIQAYFKYFGY